MRDTVPESRASHSPLDSAGHWIAGIVVLILLWMSVTPTDVLANWFDAKANAKRSRQMRQWVMRPIEWVEWKLAGSPPPIPADIFAVPQYPAPRDVTAEAD